MIGAIEWLNGEIVVGNNHFNINEIKEIRLDYRNYNVLNAFPRIVSELVVENKDNVSLYAGRGGCRLEKIYSTLSLKLNTGGIHQFGFYIDSKDKLAKLQSLISWVYVNQINFKEYTDSKRSYFLKNDLMYEEIQMIKEKHHLESWI
ncbi:hypothetical protein KMW28_24715 [Flammeovirga yaeyamensis]|uniref:Uncharacterized protein n=1 Tax=Flammeovirga yaeyamensis TaxID=367791 RepID=A0AAX1NA57_9BACT|nr:hypothetical protein [Flammeovirga yaeyamensis]QWG04097.1 hypothetical protein KMW28_24715 [Flammeovirga yaeyamensis]